jgi:diadenosine tetraphosphate (Ap4A) HIT family hydrolase
MTELAASPDCPYCLLQVPGHPEPIGGWITRGEYYLVQHGEPESSGPGAVKIVARRHFVDFADMIEAEAEAFGSLVSRLDRALRATTDAERVHLVSTSSPPGTACPISTHGSIPDLHRVRCAAPRSWPHHRTARSQTRRPPRLRSAPP